MARESSPTPLTAAPATPTPSGGERPSLNESLDELARVSDDLIDQLSGGPAPVAAVVAKPAKQAPAAQAGPAGIPALGADEPELDAIFSDLEAAAATALPTGHVAHGDVDRPVADRTPHSIREVLEHLEALPTAKRESPWESIEPSAVPDARSAPATQTPSSPRTATETPTGRGAKRYWLIAAGLAIAAGLGGAFLLQGPRTEKQPPSQPVRLAPAPIPAPTPEPSLAAPEPPVQQEVTPPPTAEAPVHIDSPEAPHPATAPSPVKVKAKAARTAVPAAAKPATRSPVAVPQPSVEVSAISPPPAEQPPVEAPPPAAAAAPTAPADRPAETPQVEYKFLDTPPAEAAPAEPAPARPVYEPPRVIARTQPVYPADARARGESGTIVLRVLVSETGAVERGVIEAGIPGSRLEAAAIDAVMSWTYEPARQSGRPVRAWITERIVFAL